MARALGVRRDTLNQYTIRPLVERGHLRSEKRGRDKPNHYFFVLKEGAEPARFEDHDVGLGPTSKNHDVGQDGVMLCGPAPHRLHDDSGQTSSAPGWEGGARARRERAKPRGNGRKEGRDLTKRMLKQEAGDVEDDDGGLRAGGGRVVE